MICAAGHRKDKEELCAGAFTKIPLDIFFIGWLTLVAISILLADEFWGIAAVVYLLVGALPICLVLVTSFLADFRLRVKLGKWWQNTVIYFVCHFCIKVWKSFGTLIKKYFLRCL